LARSALGLGSSTPKHAFSLEGVGRGFASGQDGRRDVARFLDASTIDGDREREVNRGVRVVPQRSRPRLMEARNSEPSRTLSEGMNA
jgi:hypothetical protein